MVITRRLCYLLVIPKWCAAQWQWGLLLQIANWLVLRCEYCRWKNRLLFVHFILWLFLWQSRKRSSCLFEWEIPNSSNWTIFLFCLPWIVALIAKGNFCECINYTFVCWLASDVQWLKSVLYGMVIIKTPEISQLSQVSNFPAQQTGSADSFVSLKKAISAFSMLESGKQFHRLVELRALSTGDIRGWQEPLPTRFLGQHHQQMITRHTGAAASGDRFL